MVCARSDAELLVAWTIDADAVAVQQLLRRHAAALRSDIRRTLGAYYQSFLLDEILTHVLEVLVTAGDSVKRPDAVAAWMRRVATYKARSVRRGLERRQLRSSSYAACDRAGEGTEEEEWQEARRLLPDALAALPIELRCVVEGMVLEAVDQQSLADALGITDRAVRKRFKKALAALQVWYRRHGFSDVDKQQLLRPGNALV